MRVPDPFKKCVCFLCIRQVQNGQELYRYGGTAFFVAVQLGDLQFHYLVTARHCVERASAQGGLYARINRLDGRSDIITLADHWRYHANDASDIAIMPIVPDAAVFDHVSLNVDKFATPALIAEHSIGTAMTCL